MASYQQLQIFGLGAGPQALVAPIRSGAIRTPLAEGQHEIFGTVQQIRGSTITMAKRTGVLLAVDATPALASGLANPLRLGGAVVARGAIDDAGVLHAQTLLRAKGNPAIWLPDR